MGKHIILIMLISVSSCVQRQSSVTERGKVDTIYADTHHLADRTYFKGKHPVIKISGTDNSFVDFEVGKADTVSIVVSNFRKYQTEIRNEKQISLNRIAENLYLITPHKSPFYLEVWQNYDSGKVVLKRFDIEGRSYVSSYNGWRIVGKSDFEAKSSNFQDSLRGEY
ncbi:MAG: hypothetical protein AAGA64_15565 [Bacteroidota bacterium]